MKRYVIYDPAHGIFLGEFLGLVFWSKMDRADQTHAPSFDTKEEAQLIANFYVKRSADLDGNIQCIDVDESSMDKNYVDITIAEHEITKNLSVKL